MPTVSFDAQSFMIDGRRIWLAGGGVDYARLPRGLWRHRIRTAKQAGLNCIETFVPWSLHEPRPGVFDFQGQNDLRHFIEIIASESMFCVLKPGPYIGQNWDFGGLPPWLLRIKGSSNNNGSGPPLSNEMGGSGNPALKGITPPSFPLDIGPVRLRQADGPFLEACARYFGAVMEQVRDLQVTSSAVNPAVTVAIGGGGGPIILVQVEHQWRCHYTQQADVYLRELVRFLRENGCEVPISLANNLWQRLEGTIDTWTASDRLSADLRQLRTVQPHAPRMVTISHGPPAPGSDYWGQPRTLEGRGNGAGLLFRLAESMAAGSQFNLASFCGGTQFGFTGGHTAGVDSGFITTSGDDDAPVHEAGGQGPKYAAVKRIATFASQFGHVFAALDSARHAAISAPDEQDGVTVIHQHGSQGQVVFVFKGVADKSQSAKVLLTSGLSVTVPFEDESGPQVTWLLVGANLSGVAELTLTNLCPWAFIGKQMLVLFGPAGAEGLVSINEAPIFMRVPTGQLPFITQLEGLTVVVMNGEQADAACITPNGIIIGASGLDNVDQPQPLAGWSRAIAVALDGTIKRPKIKPRRRPSSPRLGQWRQARLSQIVNGKSDAFAPIDGPASLEQLKCDFGYGWYRLAFAAMQPSGKLLAPQGGDRLHIYRNGRYQGIIGAAPGAIDDPVSMALGGNTVILADNLGRNSSGLHFGKASGAYGHFHAVKPVILGKPKVVAERSPDPFVLSGFVPSARFGESRPAQALYWSVQSPGSAKGNSLILELRDFPLRTMVFVNRKPLALYDPASSSGALRLVLTVGQQLRAGKNELKLALFDHLNPKVRPVEFLTLYRSTAAVSAKAQWAFQKWAVAQASDFAKRGIRRVNEPCWYRTTFNVGNTSQPLFVEIKGMSKGQIFLNGHNVGRYFVGTASGKPVPPQKRYYLPEPWLKTDGPNELLLFDEHGKRPRGCRLIYDANGPYGD